MIYTLMIPGALFAIAFVVMFRAENRSTRRQYNTADRLFTGKGK